MILRKAIISALTIFLSMASGHAQDASEDIGQEQIGKIQATVYYGRDEELGDLGKDAKPISPQELERLQSIEKMQFKNYLKLGEETRSVLRSYENWLSPLKPSKEIMLSFESRGLSKEGGLRLDLELWQHKRKVMKSDPVLYQGKPLLILGPKWRNGRLIIAVEVTELPE